MIKIIIADDQKIFLDGLRAILEKHEDIEIVAEATTGDQVLEILKTDPVDVVILDITMPAGLDGIETTKAIRKDFENTKVLILSMWDNKEYIVKLIQYGASGYILKNKAKEELLMALHSVAKGKTHYGLEIMKFATEVSNIDEDEEVQLTKREVEVMQKVAEGYSSKEIANLMNLATTTIDKHRQHIYDKLGIQNSILLTRYAIKHGYVKL